MKYPTSYLLLFCIAIILFSCGQINIQDDDQIVKKEDDTFVEDLEVVQDDEIQEAKVNEKEVTLSEFMSIKEMKKGSCFQSKLVNKSSNGRKKIKLIGHKWELVPVDGLYTYEVTKGMEKSGDFKKIEVERILRPAHTEAYFSSSKDDDESLNICFVEIPAKKDKVFRYELLNKDLEIERKKFNYPQMVIVAPQRIETVPKKYEHIAAANDESRWMKEGEWTEWTETGKPQVKMSEKEQITEVQKILSGKGYDAEITGVMDKRTKEAIREFQSSRGLKVGDLDSATLLELGIR